MISCTIAINDDGHWIILKHDEPNHNINPIIDQLYDDYEREIEVELRAGVYSCKYDWENKFINIKRIWDPNG